MKKHLFRSLLTVAVITLLVSGASFALFTATTSNASNTFTAGTVTFYQPESAFIDIENLAPGDTGTAGTLAVTYTGSLDAWLGLDSATSGAIFGGATPLEVTISDGANTYLGNAADQVVGLFHTGDSVTFTTSYSMPLAADNSYQSATGSVSLLVHAVQAKNNTNSENDGPISWN